MGKTRQPLKIVIDSSLVAAYPVEEWRAQGHTITIVGDNGYQLFLAPYAHYATVEMAQFAALMISRAKQRVYHTYDTEP